MNTDIKATSKTDYTEKVLNLTDPRFLAEAENHRFTQRRSPASVWAAAACFTLIFAAACAFLFRPKGERPIEAGPTAVPTATPAPAQRLIFSPGNEFPDYGADVLENYDAIELDYPEGNPYYTGSDAKPLAAKLLLPKGWTVKDGRFDGTGYYPTEEFASYCMPERTGNAVKSIYSESGECVGSIGLAATTAEYPGIANAFAPITMGKGAFRFTDDETTSVSSGKNGEAYTGRSQYATTPASSEPLSIELPVLISYDSEFLVGLVIEFGQSAVTDGQLIQIAESVRFALLNTAAAEPATAEPTAAVPTATPFPYSYNREEYEALRDFFLLEDENGVKNGEKCFKGYDPNKVKFWGPEPDGDADESRLIWNDDGNPWGSTLNSIILEGLSDETRLVGSIRLDKFSSLVEFSANRIIFESLNADVRNSFNANDISDKRLLFGSEGETVLIADYIDDFNIASFSHCRYESTCEMFGGALAFTADLTADGSGSVGVRGYMDTHYYIVHVYAGPKEGNEFIGWYDAEGSLISTEETIEISYIDENGTGVHDFTGTARFSNDPLETDPWYLEKAWEYAECANREYGFRFTKDAWRVWDGAIVFDVPASSEEADDCQQLNVYFSRNERKVTLAELFSYSVDAPIDYSALTPEQSEALNAETRLLRTVSVTAQELLDAGYTLDGTEQDYPKIAEYCGNLNAARLMICSENNPNRCIEASVGNVRINKDVHEQSDRRFYYISYYFRPAYPMTFVHRHVDIGCFMTDPSDAEHPGFMTFTGDAIISRTDDGWQCELAFVSGW